jgi:BirA family biotin operon repressor/biotin-[acetyl-CoA-carboxylase] ligase
LEIIYLKSSPSTHLELIEKLEDGTYKVPIALSADMQYNGIGSRGNSWQGLEGNLFLSFALDINTLPEDLPKHAISIYFSYIMKETLFEFGSKLFLKWPNDFYLNDKKIGGTITKILKDKIVVCSMGINLKNAPKEFEIIDINIDKNRLIKSYFLKLKEDILWKKIFRKYQVEFSRSQRFLYYDEVEKRKVSLKDAKLLEDGSIMLNGREVYSLR